MFEVMTCPEFLLHLEISKLTERGLIGKMLKGYFVIDAEKTGHALDYPKPIREHVGCGSIEINQRRTVGFRSKPDGTDPLTRHADKFETDACRLDGVLERDKRFRMRHCFTQFITGDRTFRYSGSRGKLVLAPLQPCTGGPQLRRRDHGTTCVNHNESFLRTLAAFRDKLILA
jgi:hypothetical protein